MNRIDKTFERLKKKGEKALITYITAGFPDMEETVRLVDVMTNAGADIIELGIPYSDPLADGPVLQRASAKALEKGVKVCDIFNAVRTIRENSDIPLVFLSYYNTMFKYGAERFLRESKEAGIDGLVIPDLPLEERSEISDETRKTGLNLIPLVAPTSHERIKEIVKDASGFVYCVSTTGVTGARKRLDTDIAEYMKEVAGYTTLPRAIGFGVSGPDMARMLKEHCEGIIVGSAIVRLVEESMDVSGFVNGIRKALDE